jgi:hypothetical protein
VPVRVELRTGTEFVGNAVIPDFSVAPDTIVWGDRIFVYNTTESDEKRFIYLECFSYALPEIEK